MIAHYLLDPEKRHNLDQLSRNILKYNPITIESLIGSKSKPTKKMSEVDLNEIEKSLICLVHNKQFFDP